MWVADLSAKVGFGALFWVMFGLMAFRALTGASARAAVPICVAKEAYCSGKSIVGTLRFYQCHAQQGGLLDKMQIAMKVHQRQRDVASNGFEPSLQTNM